MSIRFEASSFAGALRSVKDFVARNDNIPILNAVRVEASGGVMRVSATNTAQYAEASLPCEGALEPQCWPAWFAGTLAAGAGRDVTVSVDGSAAKADCGGRSRYTASILPASDFPVFEPALPEPVVLPAKELSQALKFALSFTDASDPRPFATGVHVEMAHGSFRATGYNGRHLGSITFAAAGTIEPIVIPACAAEWIAGISDGDIVIAAGASAMRAHAGDTELVTKLIEDAALTDWASRIREPSDRQATFDAREAVAALKRLARAMSATPKHNRAWAIHVSASGETITFAAPGIGSETIPAEVGAEVQECGIIGAQTIAVLNALIGIGCETVTFDSSEISAMQLFVTRPNVIVAGAPVRIVPAGLKEAA